MGRVSKEEAARNREKVVAVASSLFRRKGLHVGIDELMAEAGLTRGGFYGQFESKDELAGEACLFAFDTAEKSWTIAAAGDADKRLHHLVKFYFAPTKPGSECPMASLAQYAAHTPSGSPVRQAFTSGLRNLARIFAGKKTDERALAIMAAMVGAAVLGRATDDAAFARKIRGAVLKLASEQDQQAGTLS